MYVAIIAGALWALLAVASLQFARNANKLRKAEEQELMADAIRNDEDMAVRAYGGEPDFWAVWDGVIPIRNI